MLNDAEWEAVERAVFDRLKGTDSRAAIACNLVHDVKTFANGPVLRVILALLGRIAELEKRPTHESFVQWLGLRMLGTMHLAAHSEMRHAIATYRAEFMEPTDAD